MSEDARTLKDLRQQIDFITETELASILDLSQPRIAQLVSAGTLTADHRGRLPRLETLKAAVAWLRSLHDEGKTLAAKTKQEKAQLEVEALRRTAAKEEASLIPIEEAFKAQQEILLLSRQKFLGLGNKLAPRIPYLKDERAIEEAINEEVREALKELSRPLEYSSNENLPMRQEGDSQRPLPEMSSSETQG